MRVGARWSAGAASDSIAPKSARLPRMPIEALRTPDERFAALPDFPYAPEYIDDLPGYEGLRVAFIDEGPRDGSVVLCLHGEPTWSFLYRKMIPIFVEAGHRVIAPDWLGFGRSDKPIADGAYTWAFHHDMMCALVDRLALHDITLVVQDWGGLLGLTLPVTHPALIKRLLIMNTALATGLSPGRGFLQWRDYVAKTPDLQVGELIRRSEPSLSDAELAAYDAPFPDRRYKAGVRRFPQLVAIEPDMDGAELARQAARWWSAEWSGQTFMAVGVDDPVLGPPIMSTMRALIRGCPEPMLVAAGHFVQEQGAPIARAALAAWAK